MRTNIDLTRYTDEQRDAIETAVSGKDTVIHAYAGAGKTSTLKAISQCLPGKSILYVAFNRSVVDEARRKFGRHVKVATAHALAYESIRGQYPHLRQRSEIYFNRQNLLRAIQCEAQDLPLQEGIYLRYLKQCVASFTASCASEIDLDHLSFSSLYKELAPEKLSHDRLAEIAVHLVMSARKLWQELSRTDIRYLPLQPNQVLKLWSLGEPRIGRDVILFDEAQDADPVMLSVFQQQAAQKIVVGDSYQQLYRWRGAVDAMRKITGEQRYLTQSFRFGEAIAAVANDLLDRLKAPYPLRGNPTIDDWVSVRKADHLMDVELYRSNAGLFNGLIQAVDEGRPVRLNGGVADIVRRLQMLDRVIKGETGKGIMEGIKGLEGLLAWVETEEGSEFAALLKLLLAHGATHLIDLLDKTQLNDSANACLLSTVHKAKGLEWRHVELGEDFYEIDENQLLFSELQLNYVAVTRAQKILDISRCGAISSLRQSRKTAPAAAASPPQKV